MVTWGCTVINLKDSQTASNMYQTHNPTVIGLNEEFYQVGTSHCRCFFLNQTKKMRKTPQKSVWLVNFFYFSVDRGNGCCYVVVLMVTRIIFCLRELQNWGHLTETILFHRMWWHSELGSVSSAGTCQTVGKKKEKTQVPLMVHFTFPKCDKCPGEEKEQEFKMSQHF